MLEQTGDNLEPETKTEINSILRNRMGSRGKLTLYRKSLTTVDIFHYKILLYMLSFIIRISTKFLIKKVVRNGKINKFIFYFIYFHNRVHFVLFNIILSGCVFLNARSILHMKYFPDTIWLFMDKIINILYFFFYWWDILELLESALKSGIDIISSEKKEIAARVDDFSAVRIVKKYLKTSIKSEKTTKNKIMDKKSYNSKSGLPDLPPSSDNLDDTTKVPKELLEKLPASIPGRWMNPKEASKLGYERVEDSQKTADRVKYNESMVAFSAHNTGLSKHKYFIALRIEGFLLRTRLIIY